MKIHGLQKMTLLDFPGHVACTVFLSGCDFRCPYCHNFELAKGKARAIMEEDELLTFLKKRVGLLDGVAFTGGEPCLCAGLLELLLKIRELGFATKLDTNGNHPKRLQSILDLGLVDYVAMDIKNSPEKYAMTVGVPGLELSSVRESIDILLKANVDYEFRTTVVKEFHEAEDFEKIGQMIKGARRYFLQSFTDRDSVPCRGLHAPAPKELTQYLDIASKYIPDVQLRGVE